MSYLQQTYVVPKIYSAKTQRKKLGLEYPVLCLLKDFYTSPDIK